MPSDSRFSKLSDTQQRARVYAAGAAPIVGPFAAASEAGRLAPEGQQRGAFRRQVGGYYAGAASGGLLGGSAAVGAASRSHKVEHALNRTGEQTRQARTKIAERVGGRPGKLIAPTGPGRISRGIGRAATRPGAIGRIAKPLAAHPGAAGVGGYAGKAVGAGIGSYLAYSESLRRQHQRDAKMGGVSKGIAATGMSQREQREQLKRKRRNLGISMVTAGLGATGAGLLAARELGPHVPKAAGWTQRHAAQLERAGLSTSLASGGVGAYGSAKSIGIQRRDLAAQEKVLASKGLGGQRQPTLRSSFIRRTRNGGLVRVANSVAKIDTTLSHRDAEKVKAQYGLKGPLPHGLPREEKIRAYEGRYIAAGGPKGEKWKRRSNDFDHITGATIAGAAAGVGAKHFAESKPGGRVLLRRHLRPEHIAGRAGHVAETLGAAGAASELLHRHAQHRAASYRSSPAGVAASALTRLRNYTPDD